MRPRRDQGGGERKLDEWRAVISRDTMKARKLIPTFQCCCRQLLAAISGSYPHVGARGSNHVKGAMQSQSVYHSGVPELGPSVAFPGLLFHAADALAPHLLEAEHQEKKTQTARNGTAKVRGCPVKRSKHCSHTPKLGPVSI